MAGKKVRVKERP